MPQIPIPRFIRKQVLAQLPAPMPTKIAVERWLRGREECMRLDRSDAVIVSYEKSGRTWLRVLLSRFYQQRHDLPEDRLLQYDKLHRLNAAVPVVTFTHDRHVNHYAGRADHRHYDHKPLVLLVRDPRDVAVSLYFQWRHRVDLHNRHLDEMPMNDDTSLFEFVMRPESGMPAIIAFMNRWLVRGRALPGLVMYRYEDLRADPEPRFLELLRTLGAAPTAEEVAATVAYADFEQMRERERRGESSDGRLSAGDVDNPDSFKARRAKVGGYRDYFDAEQLDAIDGVMHATLDPSFGYGGGEAGSPAATATAAA